MPASRLLSRQSAVMSLSFFASSVHLSAARSGKRHGKSGVEGEGGRDRRGVTVAYRDGDQRLSSAAEPMARGKTLITRAVALGFLESLPYICSRSPTCAMRLNAVTQLSAASESNASPSARASFTLCGSPPMAHTQRSDTDGIGIGTHHTVQNLLTLRRDFGGALLLGHAGRKAPAAKAESAS